MTAAVPLRPQLQFHQLGKTRDIASRIPQLPPDQRDDSFQMRNMLGTMRLQAASQAQFSAKEAEL